MKTVHIKRNDLFKGIDMVLFNNILEADDSFIEDNFEMFSTECEVCEGTGENKEKGKCEECYGEGKFDAEPYQYFAISISDWQIKRLKSYGVNIGYSEKLDLYILPIYDFGTTWDAFSYSKEVEDGYTLSFDETLQRQTPY